MFSFLKRRKKKPDTSSQNTINPTSGGTTQDMPSPVKPADIDTTDTTSTPVPISDVSPQSVTDTQSSSSGSDQNVGNGKSPPEPQFKAAVVPSSQQRKTPMSTRRTPASDRPPASSPVLKEIRQVAEGECSSTLAAANGFPDYKDFYSAQKSQFKSDYPNPNQLALNAAYSVPVKQTKNETRSTGAVHVFSVKGTKTNLRIKLVDRDDKPAAVQSCIVTLGADAKMFPAAKLHNGLAELKSIPLAVLTGSLFLTRQAPAAYKHPEPVIPLNYTPGSKMKYPPEIREGEFLDKEEKDYVGEFAASFSWNLKLGSLPTIKVLEGIEARLNNLGFSTAKGLEAGVAAFQRRRNIQQKQTRPITGKWRDIQDDILKLHDEE